MISRLEVGQAHIVMGGDQYALGRKLALNAQANQKTPDNLPIQLALLFTKPDLASQTFLNGVRDGLGESSPPLIGCTTAYPISSTSPPSLFPDAVLTLIMAEDRFFKAHVAVGLDVFHDSMDTLKRALSQIDLPARAEERRGFLLVITPGFKYQRANQDPGSYIDHSLIDMLCELVDCPVTVIGGSSADGFLWSKARQFANHQIHHNSVILGFVETSFSFRTHYEFGLNPETHGYPVELLDPSQVKGQNVSKIDGKDARAFVEHLSQKYQQDPIVFGVGDDIHDFYYARPFPTGNAQTIRFQRDLPQSALLRPVQPKEDKMLLAAAEMAQDAVLPNHCPQPRLCFVVSCAGRTRLLPNEEAFAAKEIEAIRDQIPSDVTLAGFYGYGEHCGSLPSRDISRNYAITSLTLGNGFDRSGALLHKLRTFARISAEVQFMTEDRDIAIKVLEALNEVGYAGGMISLVKKQGGEPSNMDREESVVKGAYAIDAECVDWGKWTRIQEQSIRLLPSNDILALIVRGEVKSPAIIPDSAVDMRCDQEAITKGQVQGQIVYLLSDPGRDPQPFGTLQIGLPPGHRTNPIEIEALGEFARMAAKSLSNNEAREELRGQLQRLNELSVAAVSGESVDNILAYIVTRAVRNTDADYASIRLVDRIPNSPNQNRKSCMYYRTYSPHGDPAWTKERLNTPFPLERESATEEFKYIATKVYEDRKPYRTNSTDRPYISKFFDGVTGDLSIPLILNEEVIGVLTVNSRDRHFSHIHEYRLDVLARTAAAAVTYANAQVKATALGKVTNLFLQPLGDRLPERVDQERLSATAKIITEALHCESCSIFLVAHDAPRQIVLTATTSDLLKDLVNKATYKFGEGLTGGVAKTKQALRLRDVTDKQELKDNYPLFVQYGIEWKHKHNEYPDELLQKQWLGVPIVWQGDQETPGELLGVIRCVAKAGIEHFSANDEYLLTTISEWLAVAIKTTQADSRERERNKWRLFSDYLIRHQLKSPLTASIAHLERIHGILEKPGSAEGKREEADNFAQESRARLHRLLRLIEMLRILSQVGEIGKLHLKPRQANLWSVAERAIREALDEFQIDHPNRQIPSLKQQAPVEPIMVNCYHVLVREAIKNLVSNALKYCDPKGSVRVAVSQQSAHTPMDANMWVVKDAGPQTFETWAQALSAEEEASPLDEVVLLTVSNTGSELSRQKVESIFMPMMTEQLRSDDQGYGLGLTIVKDVLGVHSGTVVVHSTEDSTVHFTLAFPKEKHT